MHVIKPISFALSSVRGREVVRVLAFLAETVVDARVLLSTLLKLCVFCFLTEQQKKKKKNKNDLLLVGVDQHMR